MGTNISTVMVVVALAAGLWWGFSRRRHQAMLEVFSIAALALAGAHARWSRACVGSLFRGRFSLSRSRCCCASALAARSLAPLAEGGRARRAGRRAGARRAGAPDGARADAAEAVGAARVGSVVFRWTDTSRAETFTADPSDRRQVVAQAWYPTDATTGRAVPYFEAQGRLPSSIAGLPSFMFASFGSVATHATVATPVSAAQRTWPVLFFSPGLSIPREAVHGSLR